MAGDRLVSYEVTDNHIYTDYHTNDHDLTFYREDGDSGGFIPAQFSRNNDPEARAHRNRFRFAAAGGIFFGLEAIVVATQSLTPFPPVNELVRQIGPDILYLGSLILAYQAKKEFGGLKSARVQVRNKLVNVMKNKTRYNVLTSNLERTPN